MTKQSLQIKRNKNIFTTKEDAVNHLKSLVENLADGEIVLCRYFNDKTIQTLVGFETKYEVTNPTTNEIEIQSSIAYVDTFNQLGKGLSYDNKNIINVNVGDGLKIDNNNNVTLNLSNGLQIKNKQLAVKLHEQNNVKNFLTVDGDGMKVVEMDTNVTSTTERILVMGGPLAELAKDFFPKDSNQNPYIEKDTNLQDLLFKLFCKEEYPTVTSGNSIQGNVTASIEAPIITLSTTGNVEVGTSITVTARFKGVSTANTRNSIVSGLTYGYSTLHNNIREHSGTTINKIPSVNRVKTSNMIMSCDLTNFTRTKFNNISQSGDTLPSISGYTLGQVTSGVNTITVSITGQPYTYSIDAINPVYPCSNIGKTSSSVTTTQVEAISGITEIPFNTTSGSVTGVRYGYYGIITDNPEVVGQETFDYTSANIRKLTALKSKKTFTIQGNNVGRVIIAIPTSWNAEIDSIKDEEQMNTDLFGSETGYPTQFKTVAVEGANNYQAENYKVYTYDPQSPISINQTITFK